MFPYDTSLHEGSGQKTLVSLNILFIDSLTKDSPLRIQNAHGTNYFAPINRPKLGDLN